MFDLRLDAFSILKLHVNLFKLLVGVDTSSSTDSRNIDSPGALRQKDSVLICFPNSTSRVEFPVQKILLKSSIEKASHLAFWRMISVFYLPPKDVFFIVSISLLYHGFPRDYSSYWSENQAKHTAWLAVRNLVWMLELVHKLVITTPSSVDSFIY
jgi:hypothetical protein